MSVRAIVGGTFCGALALRLLALQQLHTSGVWDYLRLDPLYYHEWAVRISGGELIGSGTYEMTPLYAWLLGGVYALCGTGLWVPRLIQCAAGSGICALVALLGCRVFGNAAGLVAGAGAALYGPLIFHDLQIMKTSLTVCLATVTAAALWRSGGSRTVWIAIAGALMGATALTQENLNVILPVMLAWIAVRSPRGTRLRHAAILVAAWACVIAPATIRNAAVSGDFVLITSGGGEVFYTGNNENASGRYRIPHFVRPDPFFEHEDFRAEAARRLGRPVTRKESDAFWWREGVRFITDHPRAYVSLLADKLATFFNSFERPDNYSYYLVAEFVPLLQLPLLRFGWVAPFGVLGMLLALPRWRDLLPLYATVSAFVLSALLFFTQDRYRMPMIPLLILFGGHAASWLAATLGARRWRSLAWCLPLLALLAAAMNRDPGNNLAFEAQNRGILGEMRLYAGQAGRAREDFDAALGMLRGYPGDTSGRQHDRVIAAGHFGIALAIEMDPNAGTQEERIEHLRAALDAPDADTRRDAADRLGAALMARSDFAGAARALQAAVEAAPDSFSMRLHLAEAQHRAGDPQAALRTVQAALAETIPASAAERADAHYGLALVHRDLGDPAAMREQLRICLAANPAHPRAAWIRAQLGIQ